MCGLFIACCIYGIIHQTRKTSSLYFVLLKIQLCKLHLKNSILLNVIMNNFLHLCIKFLSFIENIYVDFLRNDCI